MPSPVIRRATTRDLLELPAMDPAYTPTRAERLSRLMTPDDGVVLVADEGDTPSGELLGYVAVARRDFFGRDFIELLVVRPTERRRGVGAQLLRAAFATATTSAVFTSTNESNSAMRALLTREQWSLSGTLDGLDDGDPEFVFVRRR